MRLVTKVAGAHDDELRLQDSDTRPGAWLIIERPPEEESGEPEGMVILLEGDSIRALRDGLTDWIETHPSDERGGPGGGS